MIIVRLPNSPNEYLHILSQSNAVSNAVFLQQRQPTQFMLKEKERLPSNVFGVTVQFRLVNLSVGC
jgi:hypothetical protein